jgi:hypothetical protein
MLWSEQCQNGLGKMAARFLLNVIGQNAAITAKIQGISLVLQ